MSQADHDPSSPQAPNAEQSPSARLRSWFLGPPPLSKLTVTHCLHSAAEAFVTVSLAGSIFFSVSAEAARPRVLLFLVVSFAPFLVLAPLIGPVVDRIRGGLRMGLMVTFALRMVLALVLAEHLRTLLLFPLVFGILVVANGYSVARNALVPTLVEHPERDLIAANARLTRSATLVGALAASAAVGVYATTSGAWSLRAAALVYGIALVSTRRIPKTSAAVGSEPATSDFVLDRAPVDAATIDMLVLRATAGFAVFAFAFALRSDAETAWMFGALIAANGGGSFLGTVITPRLRNHLDEQSMFTAALGLATSATVLCGVVFNVVTLIFTMFAIGLATSIGRRALDATIQSHGSHGHRGRVYARLEMKLELAWAAAAAVAVAVGVAPWIAVLSLSGFLLVATVLHIRRARLQFLHPIVDVPLRDRLLLRADALVEQGLFDEAVVVAVAARDPLTQPPPLSAAELHDIVSGTLPVDRVEAERVIAAVRNGCCPGADQTIPADNARDGSGRKQAL